MKIYVVSELNWEYDDEYYNQPEGGGGSPVKAFRVRENATAERDRLNEEARRERTWCETEEGPVTDFYEVNEVEVDDDDVESYADARSRVSAALEASKEAARKEFGKGSAAVFEEFAVLESFGWSQYTDYFNDGEPCTFYARTCSPHINGEDSDEIEYDDGYGYCSETHEYKRVREADDISKAIAGVRKFLEPFDDDDLYAMFGDHVTVTVNRDGSVETETCDHD